MASRTYWASLPGDKIIGELQERRTAYYDQVNQDGRMDCWDISQRYYYGLNSNGGYRETQVQFAGKQGEALLLSDNEYRSLLDTFHTLVCGDRMGISAMASNPSPAAVNAATLADGIVDFFSEHEGLEQAQNECARIAIQAGEGHQLHRWDPTIGRLVMVEQVQDPGSEEIDAEGNPVMTPLLDEHGRPMTKPTYEGDVNVLALHPVDVVRDPISPEMKWREVRLFMNRYDLAALYPEHRQKILDAESASDSTDLLWRSNMLAKQGTTFRSDDTVCAHLFLHPQSPSMLKGRELLHCGGATLYDRFLTPDPTKNVDVPLHCLPFELEIRSPFGSSRAWDLLSLQEALNAAISTILTNHDATGQRILAVGHDGGIEPTDVQGLILVKSTETPSPINLGGISGDQFQLVDMLVGTMTRIMGLNSVARGEPDAKMSGTAYALLHSMALQAAAGFQRHYAQLVEWNANQLITLLKRNVREQRFIDVAGKGNRSKIKAFVGDDLEPVYRIKVEIGNTLTRSVQGRLQQTELLLSNQLLKSKEEAIQMLKTGKTEQASDGPVAQETQARSENEYMQDFSASPEGAQWFAQYQAAMQMQAQFDQVQQQFQMASQQAMQAGAMPPPAPVPPPPPPPLPDGLRALATEFAHVHVPCHSTLLADPNAKSNPILLAVVTAHNAEHAAIADQLIKTNPVLIQLSEGKALSMIQPPMMAPGPTPGLGGQQQGGQGQPGPDATQPQIPGVTGQGGTGPTGPLPDMPQNPATGQPAQVPV